jgi:hypothetical protein
MPSWRPAASAASGSVFLHYKQGATNKAQRVHDGASRGSKSSGRTCPILLKNSISGRFHAPTARVSPDK